MDVLFEPVSTEVVRGVRIKVDRFGAAKVVSDDED